MGDRRANASTSERKRFYAALGLFLLWASALVGLAVFSGRRPVEVPAAFDGR